MNTDQCPEAINMFPKRDEEPYTGWEIESSQALAKPAEGGSTHLRLGTTFCGGNSQFTLFTEADKEAETRTKKKG